MFYGGSNLAHLSAANESCGDDLIKLLKINRNAIVLIDRDGASLKAALKRYKTRIISEIGRNSCWITKGREIENYLPTDLLQKFLEKRKGKIKKVKFDKDDKIEESMRRAVSKK